MKVMCTSVNILVIFSLLAGCSSQQLYDTAHGARQSACDKILDQAEFIRCTESANKSYEDYKREQDNTRKY